MSDDQTPGEGRSSEGGDREGPGGGPKRVVSETSVDDILNSLDETDKSGTSVEEEQSAEPDASSDQSATPAASASESPSGPESRTGAGGATDRQTKATPEPTDDTPESNGHEEDADEEPEIAANQDRAGDLSSRIDRGDVTGADVRAAEAGEGREKTPDIDEIDLSIDDLEATTSASTAESDDDVARSTDGPLASRGGKLDDDTDTEETPDDDGGIVDKIRGLFRR